MKIRYWVVSTLAAAFILAFPVWIPLYAKCIETSYHSVFPKVEGKIYLGAMFPAIMLVIFALITLIALPFMLKPYKD